MHMENKMIPSNSFIACLKSFFRRLFSKRQRDNTSTETISENYNVSTPEVLYQKISSDEINIEDLEDEEMDKLIGYLKNRIRGKEQELEIIKNRILNMKRKIK